MSKIKNIVSGTILFLLILVPGEIFGASVSWSDVSGYRIKNGLVSDKKAGETNIIVSEEGNIFVTYQYENKKAQVKKFDGTRWQELSDENNPHGLISIKKGGNPVLAASNGNIFVTFMDWKNGARARVKKWNGTGWSDLSDENHPEGFVSSLMGFEPDLCFDKSRNNLYLAFRDEASGNKIKVMRWTEDLGWNDVVDENNQNGFISSSFASEVSLESSKTDEGIFAAFEDLSNGGRIRVKKWDGAHWINLEDVNHPGGLVSQTAGFSPAIDTDLLGNLYLVYTGKNNKNTFLQKWNGSNWENVGNGVAVQGRTTESTIAIDERNYVYMAYSQKTTSGWRVRAKIWDGFQWTEARDGKSKNVSKGKGKGDPSLVAFNNKIYMVFTDARHKEKARVKMLNFIP